MSGPALPDVYRYGLLAECLDASGVRPPDEETWLMDLHNSLVWGLYHPREDPERDEVVWLAIRTECDRRHIPVDAVRDPSLRRLVAALA